MIISHHPITDNCKGTIKPVRASITTIFSTFDHTIFHIAILLSPFRAATTEVNNSGREVPTATTVKPITLSDIPSRFATAIAPSTTRLPHTISKPIPTHI